MKGIVIKGKIRAVHDYIGAIAKEYDGWTVDEYVRLANAQKRLFDKRRQKNF